MKWLAHRALSALLHQPALLRGVGAVLRARPALAGATATLADHRAVAIAFRRPASFSNGSYAFNLPAGEFLIGLESGPRQTCERAFLERVLPAPSSLAKASENRARQCIAAIRAAGSGHFDLIGQFLRPVAWSSVALTLGPAADDLLRSADAEGRQRMDELAWLGTHLMAGQFEPARQRARSLRAGTSLQQHLQAHARSIATHWRAPHSMSADTIVRHAAGLMLVGHPGTVQAGALIMQELLARRMEYEQLCAQARDLGEDIWAEPFRRRLREQVLRLLRARPPFPILSRALVRDADIDLAPGYPITLRARRRVYLLAVAAMADPQVPDDTAAQMVFGLGPRACFASEHAIEVLVSALSGLLSLGRLGYHDGLLRRVRYDGIRIERLRLALPDRRH